MKKIRELNLTRKQTVDLIHRNGYKLDGRLGGSVKAWAGDPEIDREYGEKIVLDHHCFGFLTDSGKFFPGVRTTRYPWGGAYRPSHTDVFFGPGAIIDPVVPVRRPDNYKSVGTQ
jgi:hypothetical protein